MGVALDSGGTKTDGEGPGQDGGLDLWVNTNGFWDCKLSGAALPLANCERRALGALTIVPTGVAGSTSFEAEQRIANGELWTRRTFSGSSLETHSVVHPADNLLVTTLSWNGSAPLYLHLSLWVMSGSDDPAAGTVARRLTQGTPRAMWAALAVRTSAPVQWSPGSHQKSGLLLTTVKVPAGGSVELMLGLADNLLTSNVTDPSAAAAALVAAADTAKIRSASDARWSAFWGRSEISLVTQPSIEEFWYGAQYIMGCMTPSTSLLQRYKGLAPPSGLYGPWVTTDNPNWNGDYTLDYNQEAQFYGVFSSNRPELAAAYFPPILDWEDAARQLAQSSAKQANISCPAKTMHYTCHLAPWGYESNDRSVYMHWNGHFAALPFISNWEYTGEGAEVTYDLLDGLNAWTWCFVQNRTTATGWVLDDWNEKYPDEEHEGQRVKNPIIGISLMRRIAQAQHDIALSMGRTAPSYISVILSHLAAYSTATTESDVNVWAAYENATASQSDMFSVYPLWPTEQVDVLTADNATRAVAAASSLTFSDLPRGRPVLLFPAAVRATSRSYTPPKGFTPEQIVDGLNAYLKNFQGANLLPRAPGGGTENVGVTQAVNDMLVRSVDGNVIVLFPTWPTGEPATFSSLRTKGGWIVTAAYNNGTVTGVVVEGTRDALCGLQNPWPSSSVQLTSRATGKSTTLAGSVVRWSVKKGEVFEVRPVADN